MLLPAWGVVVLGSCIEFAVWFAWGVSVLAHDQGPRDAAGGARYTAAARPGGVFLLPLRTFGLVPGTGDRCLVLPERCLRGRPAGQAGIADLLSAGGGVVPQRGRQRAGLRHLTVVPARQDRVVLDDPDQQDRRDPSGSHPPAVTGSAIPALMRAATCPPASRTAVMTLWPGKFRPEQNTRPASNSGRRVMRRASSACSPARAARAVTSTVCQEALLEAIRVAGPSPDRPGPRSAR